jgi:hypothetical protein
MKIKKGLTRRKFITNTALSGIGTIGSAGLLSSCSGKTIESDSKTRTDSHVFNGYYTGKNLDRIAFPVGGIGAGMFCIEGTGAISHMSVRNRPDGVLSYQRMLIIQVFLLEQLNIPLIIMVLP